MHRSFVSSLIGVFLLLGACAATDAQTIHTNQTILRLKAGDTAPQLISLQAPGHSPWSNRVPEELIRSADVDRRTVRLQWKLVPSATQKDAEHNSYIYETPAPHLRLTWEWRVPATTGPLEHRIRIENLDHHELWIPLQTSFRYSWNTATNQPLKQIYIEKGAGKPSAVGTHEVDGF